MDTITILHETKNIANRLRHHRKYIHFVGFVLLICMLKIAFPLGEYFHHHQSDTDICTHNTGKKCTHYHHISEVDYELDCIFNQLHTFFNYFFHDYKIHVAQRDFYVILLVEKYIFTYYFYTLSRAPPSHVFLKTI